MNYVEFEIFGLYFSNEILFLRWVNFCNILKIFCVDIVNVVRYDDISVIIIVCDVGFFVFVICMFCDRI